jgi:hypothetical protein
MDGTSTPVGGPIFRATFLPNVGASAIHVGKVFRAPPRRELGLGARHPPDGGRRAPASPGRREWSQRRDAILRSRVDRRVRGRPSARRPGGGGRSRRPRPPPPRWSRRGDAASGSRATRCAHRDRGGRGPRCTGHPACRAGSRWRWPSPTLRSATAAGLERGACAVAPAARVHGPSATWTADQGRNPVVPWFALSARERRAGDPTGPVDESGGRP